MDPAQIHDKVGVGVAIVGVVAGVPVQRRHFVGHALFQLRLGKVLLHAVEQLALGSTVGQIQLGVGPDPVVSVAVSGRIGGNDILDLAVVNQEQLQLGVGGDVHLLHLGAGEEQILQLGASGQIQLVVAIAKSAQSDQLGQVAQLQSGAGTVIQLNGGQVIAIVNDDLGNAGGNRGGGQHINGGVGQIQDSQAGQQVQTGKILHIGVGQIQGTGEVNQILDSGADLLAQFAAQGGIGNQAGAIGAVHSQFNAVEEQLGGRSGNIAVHISDGNNHGGNAGVGNRDVLQLIAAGETTIGSDGAVDVQLQGIPIGIHGSGQVEQAIRLQTSLALIGIRVVIGQLAEVVDGLILGAIGIDGGDGQNELGAILHIDVQSGSLGALGHSHSLRSFLRGIPVNQRHFHGSEVLGRIGPGNGQLVVGGDSPDVADTVPGGQGNPRAIALGAVNANRANLQSDHIVLVLQSLDVVVGRVGAAHELHGAVAINRVNMVVLHGVVVGQIPGKLNLAGLVKPLGQRHIGGSAGGVVTAVGVHQAAQVDLEAFRLGLGGDFQADGGNGLAGISAQVNGSSLPATGGGFDGQGVDGVVVLEDDGNGNSGGVIGGLVVGQRQLGVGSHIQLGLVKVDVLAGSHVTVDDQGGATVVSADLGVGEGSLDTRELGAVVPVHIQQVVIVRFNPPLPGGQDVLQVQVGPLHIPGDLTVDIVLHTMAVVEIGSKDGTVDHGLLHDVAGEALEVQLGLQLAQILGSILVGDAHIAAIQALSLIVANQLGGAGEVHTLTLFRFPLVLNLITVVIGLVVLLAVEIGAPDCQGGVGLAVFLHQVAGITVVAVHNVPEVFQVNAVAPLAAFHTHENSLIGIQAQAFSMGGRILDGIGTIPVVQEDGVGNTAKLRILHEVGVYTVENVLVRDGAGVGHGVIPLNVGTTIHHVLHEFLHQRNVFLRNSFLLVDEVAIKAVVVHDFQQLVRVGEATVLGLLQHLIGILRCARGEILRNGQNAVLVGGVGGSRHGNGDGAVFLVLGTGSDARSGTAAGAGVVGILPELEHIVGEFIVAHVGVPGRLIDVGGTVVGGGDCVELRLVRQVGIGLSGGIGFVALLQGNAGNQLLSVGISRGIPVQDIHKAVAMAPRLIGGAGLSGRGFVTGFLGGHRPRGKQGQNENQR